MNQPEHPATVSTTNATEHVRSFIELHGRLAVTVLSGGGAAALGTILPFAHVPGFFGGGGYYSLVQSGFYGVLLLAISVVLGILPVFLKEHAERFRLAAFGAASALFGIFFAVWLAASGIAAAIGGSVGVFSIGFYMSLFGYAAMVVGYYLMIDEARKRNA